MTRPPAEAGKKASSQALELVQLFENEYRVGVSLEGEAFAVAYDRPGLALPLRGSGSLRAELACTFYTLKGRVAAQTALASALLALEGKALQAAREPVYLRVAPYGAGVAIDLGETSGRVVVVTPAGWDVVGIAPAGALFRRTELTRALPAPQSGGSLERLWRLVHVAEHDRPLVLGWLVNALLPGREYPIALFGGEQGTGKSTAAEVLAELIDPSAAPLRSAPRDVEEWAVQATGSLVVALDNLSSVPAWLSDALCRTCTGDGMVRRRLYSDAGLSVLSFCRSVVLTSIDIGAIRGDLGERLVLFALDPIPAEQRASRKVLRETLLRERPALLGALLDLLAAVLRRLPLVNLAESGRLVDFERVLACVDEELGTEGLATYRSQAGRVAEDVVASDPVAGAVVAFAQRVGSWSGAAAELLEALKPDRPPSDWPKSARALTGRLRRLLPSLRRLEVRLEEPGPNDRPRNWHLEATDPDGEAGENTVATVGPSETAPEDPGKTDFAPTIHPTIPTVGLSDRRNGNGPGGPENADSRRSDATDGRNPASPREAAVDSAEALAEREAIQAEACSPDELARLGLAPPAWSLAGRKGA